VPFIAHRFRLDNVTIGLIGAGTLLGILFGAAFFGVLTDRFGRRIMMIGDLLVFAVASLLQLFASSAAEIVVLRIVLGIAIGADYPIASALIAEYMPQRHRGAGLNSMQVTWFVGACAAYAVGYALVGLPENWRWMLASSAAPALVGLALRSSAPESARWLALHGRANEARAIVRRYFGEDERERPEPDARTIPLAAMLQQPFAGALAFVATMWLLQVIPLFAIYTFAPTVLSELRIANAAIGSFAITAAFLIGSLLAMPFLERVGRRPICIAGFLVGAVAFAAIAIGTPSIVVPAFLCYAVAIGAAAGLELIYPAELFPTPIRASATGFAAGISRVGAFVGTFALPVALERFGVTAVMWTAAFLSFAGLAIALAFAPETRRRVLDSPP
jgi:MFS transporter, putative metabolite transport protein